jgi:hypothetical protein
LTHQENHDHAKGRWSNIEPFIHIIKLDKIMSKIHKTVFRIDKDVFNGTVEERAKLDRKMAKMRADLDEWVQTSPQSPKKENKITWMYDPESAYLDARDFYGVQYHKAVLFLFTVFLPALDTTDPRFIYDLVALLLRGGLDTSLLYLARSFTLFIRRSRGNSGLFSDLDYLRRKMAWSYQV